MLASTVSLRTLGKPGGLQPGGCSPGSSVPVLWSQGRRRVSHVPREPQCACALLSDPGRTSAPRLSGTSVLPPLSWRRRLQQQSLFRGSITRLWHWLFTLRAALTGDDAKLASGGG